MLRQTLCAGEPTLCSGRPRVSLGRPIFCADEPILYASRPIVIVKALPTLALWDVYMKRPYKFYCRLDKDRTSVIKVGFWRPDPQDNEWFTN